MKKTNLNRFYQTSKDLELNGKWFTSESGASFLIKRMGGKNQKKVNESRAKHFMSSIKDIVDNKMPEEQQEKLFIKVFVESCLVDWRGVYGDNGEQIEYSSDLAEDVLFECPDLFDELVEAANDRTEFKKVEDLGNS